MRLAAFTAVQGILDRHGEDFWLGEAFMDESPGKIRWPHAPPHFLVGSGTFMVTASTYGRVHHFGSRMRLRMLTNSLIEIASKHGWALEAWAVMANHYHWIGKSPATGAESLGGWIAELHRESARFVNRLDRAPGRQVWHNYMETRLTFEKSYLARLNYVIQNPVKHGLVHLASDYPWCSAAWFSRNASPAFQKTVNSFRTDRLDIEDDF
jgi:putative transposase